MFTNKYKFCIVGLGLIGGSYAMALTSQGYHVSAIDVNSESIEYGLKNNIIAQGFTNNYDDMLKNCDVVVLCLYPSDCVAWALKHKNKFKNGAIITDICGVKSAIVYKIQSFLPSSVEFIACHPMAGKEVSGVQNADFNIFKKANFIVVPTKNNTQSAIDFAFDLGNILGFNCVSCLTCEEHDNMIAFLSQLTHAIAVSLMNTSKSDSIAKYTGDSFKDLTRIAKINAPMWRELFLCNKDLLLAQIDEFTQNLCDLKTKLENNDAQGLEQLFENSTQRRIAFDELKNNK